jgi:hypothetical protein
MARVAPHFLDAHFLNAEGQFEFELDPAPKPVVDVNIRSFIGTSEGTALAEEPKVDLPVFVSRSIGIVR